MSYEPEETDFLTEDLDTAKSRIDALEKVVRELIDSFETLKSSFPMNSSIDRIADKSTKRARAVLEGK